MSDLKDKIDEAVPQYCSYCAVYAGNFTENEWRDRDEACDMCQGIVE